MTTTKIADVLVVDDSGFARKVMIKRINSVLECTVRQAGNGEQALAAYHEQRPDVVILDLTMPVMDGYTCLAEIRKIDREIPVIIVTADVQERAKQRVTALGASAICAKPFNIETLQELFNELL